MDKNTLAAASEKIVEILIDVDDAETSASAMGLAFGFLLTMYGDAAKAMIIERHRLGTDIGKRRADEGLKALEQDGEAGE